MILKERTESDELLALRALNLRKELDSQTKFHYLNLEKGYEGEVKFDQLTKNLLEERYIINDLLLKANNSYFQIDALIISQSGIHLIDVKNFENDYYLESDKLYSTTKGREYNNPVTQLTRSSSLFRQLLQNHKFNYLSDAFVVFINPEFTLYQAPKDQPIILPTQVNRIIHDLNKTPSKLNDGHRKLAQTLISLHQTKNPFTALPEYTYEEQQKSFFCRNCKSPKISVGNFDLVCDDCGDHEKMEAAILRHMAEFKLLFPQRKITTNEIYEWCGGQLCKRTFRRVLKRNFTTIGTTSNTYFE